MDLKSCDNCGVVVDVSRMSLVEEMDDDLEEMVYAVVWEHREMYNYYACPVCKSKILEERS